MSGLTDLVGRAAARAASVAAIGLVALSIGATAAAAETRTLKFYNLHTKEKVSVAYKKNGRYIASGLKELNWFLRDWRKKQPTKMDTRLLDLIWESYRQSGSRDYIHVVCGFRSPATNNMLRSRSSGVAKESQHTAGRALDFYIPDVPLKKLREIGLRMEVGGVGYYPKSGSPFVHFDVGNARHWPRMSRKELAAVFPNGKTIHVPSDGKPLPGYQQAMASYKQRKGASAVAVAKGGDEPSGGGGKTLLAAIFGGGADEEDDVADAAVASKTPAPKTKAPKAARPAPKPEAEVAVAALMPTERPRTLPTGVALPIRDTFDASAPVPPAGLKSAEVEPAETEVAALDLSRVPIPQWAPGRAVPADPVQSPADVTSLVAALEASPAAREIAGDAAATQMAYAVPTPRNRPPFESVLKTEASAAAIGAEEAKRVIGAAARPMSAGMAMLPSERLQAETGKTAVQNLILLAAKEPAQGHVRSDAPNPTASNAPEGKTSRLARGIAKVKTPSAAAASTQEQSIDLRVEMASLVGDPVQRAAMAVAQKPKPDVLLRDLPTAVFTVGFAQGPATSVSNRFEGSAVNFLPMVKFGN